MASIPWTLLWVISKATSGTDHPVSNFYCDFDSGESDNGGAPRIGSCRRLVSETLICASDGERGKAAADGAAIGTFFPPPPPLSVCYSHYRRLLSSHF